MRDETIILALLFYFMVYQLIRIMLVYNNEIPYKLHLREVENIENIKQNKKNVQSQLYNENKRVENLMEKEKLNSRNNQISVLKQQYHLNRLENLTKLIQYEKLVVELKQSQLEIKLQLQNVIDNCHDLDEQMKENAKKAEIKEFHKKLNFEQYIVDKIVEFNEQIKPILQKMDGVKEFH